MALKIGKDKPKHYSYKHAGVDIDAGEALVEAIKPLSQETSRPGVLGGLGGFGGLFDLKATGFKDPVLVAANDGVGTKIKIAIETGRHNTIGIDLVAMCVNDLIVQGAEPLFFLDYFACNSLDIDVARSVISGIASGCKQAGAALIGGETAEMPGMYKVGEYDLAGFAVGAVERGRLLPRQDIVPGDILLGLPSSGVHSNGFSLIRKIITDCQLSLEAEVSFASGKTVGEILLEPTLIYVKSILSSLKQNADIKALCHVTGGGFTDNLPRVIPKGMAAKIELKNINPAPIFGWIASNGNVLEHEMLRTFNCGIGMVIVTSEEKVEETREIFASYGQQAINIGRISSESGKSVVFDGNLKF